MTTYTTVLDGYGDLTLWRSEGEDDPRPMPLAAIVNAHTVTTDDEGVVFRAAAAVLAPDEAVVRAVAFHIACVGDEAGWLGLLNDAERAEYLTDARLTLAVIRAHVEGSQP